MELKPEILVPHWGDYPVEKKLITSANLQEALAHQQTAWQPERGHLFLGQPLVAMGVIDKDAIDAAIIEQILVFRNTMEKTNSDLEKTVMERTAELARTLDKLAELNKMQIRFVSNISHELRTPLFHISGNLELVLIDRLRRLASGKYHLTFSHTCNRNNGIYHFPADLAQAMIRAFCLQLVEQGRPPCSAEFGGFLYAAHAVGY
ncbi:MAG: histidine kinase dimerization/phospho-acceptor domain-containing protein [Syntrophales bacterium]|jgi:signal transduction histidine kinase